MCDCLWCSISFWLEKTIYLSMSIYVDISLFSSHILPQYERHMFPHGNARLSKQPSCSSLVPGEDQRQFCAVPRCLADALRGNLFTSQHAQLHNVESTFSTTPTPPCKHYTPMYCTLITIAHQSHLLCISSEVFVKSENLD